MTPTKLVHQTSTVVVLAVQPHRRHLGRCHPRFEISNTPVAMDFADVRRNDMAQFNPVFTARDQRRAVVHPCVPFRRIRQFHRNHGVLQRCFHGQLFAVVAVDVPFPPIEHWRALGLFSAVARHPISPHQIVALRRHRARPKLRFRGKGAPIPQFAQNVRDVLGALRAMTTFRASSAGRRDFDCACENTG